MTKQDQYLRCDPYTAELHEAYGETEVYLVQSASDTETRYRVEIDLAYPEHDRCSCPARVPCNHIDRARLRGLLDDCLAKCLRHYAGWSRRELEDEDLRLRVIIAAQGAGPFLLTQYTAVGDTLAAVIAAAA